jgi:hypothetical protein
MCVGPAGNGRSTETGGGFMPFTKLFATTLVAASVSVFGAGAYASETPSFSTCLKMARQVSQAIDAHQDSKDIQKAKQQLRAGKGFCANGLYKTGISRYASALKLIGASAGAR